MNEALKRQIRECPHVPFIYNRLSNWVECLCGKAAVSADKYTRAELDKLAGRGTDGTTQG